MVVEDKSIKAVRELFKDKDRVEVNGVNSGGFEAKVGSDARDWVLSVVENNNVRFDNPNRIESGHPYILVLPTDDEELKR